jgi:hypothetical protein
MKGPAPSTWTEWAVMLAGGVICPATSEAVARFYGPEPGHPLLSRTVTLTPGGTRPPAVTFTQWAPVREAA